MTTASSESILEIPQQIRSQLQEFVWEMAFSVSEHPEFTTDLPSAARAGHAINELMRRRWWIAAVLFVLAMMGIILWQESSLREPEYAGRPLGYWVSELRLTVSQRAGGSAGVLTYSDIHAIKKMDGKLLVGPKKYVESSEIPAKAIRSIGTNALPFLLGRLQREPSKPQRMLGALLVKTGLMGPISGWVSRRFGEGMQSLTAIRLLGTNAAIALPGFETLTHSRHAEVRMAGELIIRGFSTNPPKLWFNPPL